MLHCSAASVIVLGLMVLGTGYDFYLVHQSRHFFSENYTYEITRASPPHLGERPIKLDVGNFMQTATSSPTEGVINHGTLPIDSVVMRQLCGKQTELHSRQWTQPKGN